VIGLPHQLKLAAYVHSLKDLPRFKRAGFSYVALHPTLFPSVEGGIPPPAEKIQEVRKAVEASGLVPYDLATFNTWNWLGLSGMMEQLPSGPSDPEYEEIRRKGVKQYVGLIKLTKALGCSQIYSLMGGRRLYHYDHEEAWKKSVRDLAPVLEEEQVTLAFMPHPGDFVEESDAGVDLIRSMKTKRLKYVYVLPHTYVLAGRMDADPAAMIRYAADAGVLSEVHMGDSLKPAQMWIRDHFDVQPYHSHLVPGKGSIDIRAALRALVDVHFEGPVLQIPYRYGISGKSFADLAIDSKNAVERMLRP
jgi:sugar phosphate isomerase/epimerase